ncbi:hypothetical protein LF1_34530 [Rubripirellula obstinata]|uniref:Uncharacterized protein n=2 Tax=Rubripirellula obstinata TaxID=406547 RepID=A0A5B1CKS3_9BACT|nr:hypothetical protein LF1_34530 [Rubripirellula obstinata]
MRWNFRQSGRIDQDVVSTHHRLGELSLFSNEGLAQLIDLYPASAIVVETGGGNCDDRRLDDRRLGTIGNASGSQVLTMLREGDFSIILKDVAQHSRPLRRVLIRLNQEMTECSESMRICNFGGDLHLTSPGMQSPLRCDTDPVVRWQIAGNQTLVNYPDDVINRDEHIERILQHDRDVAYRTPLINKPSKNDSGWESSVHAGSMQSVMQATPHQVVQNDQVGVTLITRYQTQTSINRDDGLLSNQWLRRFEAFGLSGQPDGQHDDRHKFARRTIASFVRRKAKQQAPRVDDISFSLDSLIAESPETPTSKQPQLAC